MELVLDRLAEMHPLLGRTVAWKLVHCAAIGLERHHHVSGVALTIGLDEADHQGNLHWPQVTNDDAQQLDFHRVTEDAAEAIALATVHAGRNWVVRRRLQRGEFADWLLVDADQKPVALEVSGVDMTDTTQRRLRDKRAQLARCGVADQKATCVVELGPPRCRLRTV